MSPIIKKEGEGEYNLIRLFRKGNAARVDVMNLSEGGLRQYLSMAARVLGDGYTIDGLRRRLDTKGSVQWGDDAGLIQQNLESRKKDEKPKRTIQNGGRANFLVNNNEEVLFKGRILPRRNQK